MIWLGVFAPTSPAKERMRLLGVSASALMFIMFVAGSSAAEGEARLNVDWRNVFERGSEWARAHVEEQRTQPAQQETTKHSELGTPWFGVAPNVAVVARDWGAARRLDGGRLSIEDAFRLSRSIRMVVSRIRLGEGRVVPFAQIGLGQWRTDPERLPLPMRDTELAAQFGGGVELHLVGPWEMACEYDLTQLYREQHEPQNIPMTRLWGAFAASRVEF
jgi:hypothetical protein